MLSKGLVINENNLEEYNDFSQEEVIIPEGITNIGERVFQNHLELTKVTIPSSVQSIDEKAFFGCSGLTNIVIPNGVEYIGEYAFFNCSGITKLVIPESVIKIASRAFYNCTGLEIVEMSNGITDICERAFSCCTELKSIYIPDSVTEIEDEAFLDCYSLNNVRMPKNLNSIGKIIFAGCSEITDIVIPNISILNKEKPFYNCSKINHIKYYDMELNLEYDLTDNPLKIEIILSNDSKYEVPEFTEYIRNENGYKFGADMLNIINTNKSRVKLCNELLQNETNVRKDNLSDILNYSTKHKKDKFDNEERSNKSQNNDFEISISEKTFPSKYFRNWIIKNVAYNGNILTSEMIRNVSRIDARDFTNGDEVYSHRITLKGIEYFTDLRELSCEFCVLDSLDVSKNTKLEILNFSDCLIREIDLSHNLDLIELYCNGKNLCKMNSGNFLEHLDLSQNTKLEKVECYDNELKDITLNCPNLVSLNCCRNHLTILDLSKSPKLTKLNCSDNQIETIIVSHDSMLNLKKYKNIQIKTNN